MDVASDVHRVWNSSSDPGAVRERRRLAGLGTAKNFPTSRDAHLPPRCLLINAPDPQLTIAIVQRAAAKAIALAAQYPLGEPIGSPTPALNAP